MANAEADVALVQQVRAGNPDAWRQFVERFEGRLLAFVDSRLRDRAASEDVVAAAFIGFLMSLVEFDEKRDIEAYLFSIAAHKLTDNLRGKSPLISDEQCGEIAINREPLESGPSLTLISAERCGAIAILRIGPQCGSVVKPFYNEVIEAVGGCSHIVFDLAQVRHPSSGSSLGDFIPILRRSQNSGGRIVFCRVRPAVREHFRTSNLDRLLEFARPWRRPWPPCAGPSRSGARSQAARATACPTKHP